MERFNSIHHAVFRDKKASAGVDLFDELPIIAVMKEILHQILIGASSLMLAPWSGLEAPSKRITLPPQNAAQAVGRDFSNVSGDLTKAIDIVKNKSQLELELKCGNNA